VKDIIVENARVVDVGAKGKNIAKAGDQVILVDNAIPGDVVDIRVHKRKKGVAEGSAINFHTYSEDRIEPVCRHFYTCGGCSWQNISYEKQLFFKGKMVSDALKRIGKVSIPEIQPIMASPTIEYYRNRLDFAFSNKRWVTDIEMKNEIGFNEPGLGFHVSGKFDKVLDLHRCYLQPDPSNSIRLAARDFAIKHNYPFFDLRQQTGSLRSLIVRNTSIGEWMVIVIFHTESRKRIGELMAFISEKFPIISSLYYVINAKRNDSVFDLDHTLYSGKPYLRERIGKIKYNIGPKSFFQTNFRQGGNLILKAVELADLKGGELIYDLYTGVGSIALQMTQYAKKVIGIESVEEAIELANLNAMENDIKNVEFHTGDVGRVMNDDFLAKNGVPDVIMTDPPRTGMEPDVVQKIIEILPERIVYVSCNPATQARDLAMLDANYTVDHVQPVDMFPHTYHVENIVRLLKR